MARRIIHINTVADPRNGVGQIVRAIHSASKTAGFESAIIAGYGRAADDIHVLQGKMRTCVNAVRSRCFAEDGFIGARAAKRLVDTVRSLKPDIVHVHNLHGYYADLPSLRHTLGSLGVPVVATLHDYWMATGRCAAPVCPGFVDGSAMCARCRQKGAYPAKWFGGKLKLTEKQEFIEGLHLVVPSERMTAVFPSAAVIANGVDDAVFNRSEGAVRHSGQLVAIASHWNHAKGVDSLVRLADNLPSGMTIVMVGHGAPRHRRIVRAGYVDNPTEIARLLRTSDALLSASRIESFGFVAAEALACGTPVIARVGTAPADMVANATFTPDFDDSGAVIASFRRLPEYVFPAHIPTCRQMTEAYLDLYRSL